MIVSQENVIATEYTKLYWTFLVIHRYSPPGLPFRKRWHCQETVHLYSCLVLDSFSSGQDVRTEMAKNLIHLSLVLYIYIYIYIYASTLYIYIWQRREREPDKCHRVYLARIVSLRVFFLFQRVFQHNGAIETEWKREIVATTLAVLSLSSAVRVVGLLRERVMRMQMDRQIV